jgi:hypothetical protein
VPIGRDGPENVGRVDATQLGCAWQVFDAQLNASAATPGAFHLCLTFEARQQGCAAKLDCNRFVQRISNRYGLTFDVLLGNGDRSGEETSAEGTNKAAQSHGETTPGLNLGKWLDLLDLDASDGRIVAEGCEEVKVILTTDYADYLWFLVLR